MADHVRLLDSYCPQCAEKRGRNQTLIMYFARAPRVDCPACGWSALGQDYWGELDEAAARKLADEQREAAFWDAWDEDVERDAGRLSP